jgi:hypothetical protein
MFTMAIALIACTRSLSAQYGVTVKYQSLVASEFADLLTDVGGEYSSQLVGGSVFYWFRLKNRRVEFLPELGYLASLNNSSDFITTSLQKVQISFNTDFYVFDLEGDCNCPTFSKQGGYFQKGFFLEVSPGMDLQFIDMQNLFFEFDDIALTFRIGLGLGFDFGISDMVTITPTLGINWSGGPRWYELVDASGGEWIFAAGLRAIFRPDYKRRYR